MAEWIKFIKAKFKQIYKACKSACLWKSYKIKPLVFASFALDKE